MGFTKIYLACRVPGTQQIKFSSVPFQLMLPRVSVARTLWAGGKVDIKRIPDFI